MIVEHIVMLKKLSKDKVLFKVFLKKVMATRKKMKKITRKNKS
jgi:hypothetical protein